MHMASSQLVNRLIDALANSTRLPLAEISAIHRSGHNLQLESTEDRVIAVVGRRRDRRLSGLTSREQEVGSLVAVGSSNQQIARRLQISLATVKDHVHAILTKTGFESRTQFIAAWYGGLEDGSVTSQYSTELRPS